MKQIHYFNLFLLSAFTSCVAPVNLNFDSAKMLEKGSVEAQASSSAYAYLNEVYVTNLNFGAKAGFGVSGRYNIKLRYECLLPADGNDIYNFIEIDNKISILKNKIALSLPITFYLGNESVLVVDPRFYFTYSKSNKFEFTFAPKVHIALSGDSGILPGACLGFGFSKDLTKWAVRPEIGYDSYLSLGIGFSFYPNFKKEEKTQ